MIPKYFIAELEREPEKSVPVFIEFEYKKKPYKGVGVSVISICEDGVCQQFAVTLNKKRLGVIKCTKNGCKITGVPHGLVNAIGDEIFHWYE